MIYELFNIYIWASNPGPITFQEFIATMHSNESILDMLYITDMNVITLYAISTSISHYNILYYLSHAYLPYILASYAVAYRIPLYHEMHEGKVLHIAWVNYLNIVYVMLLTSMYYLARCLRNLHMHVFNSK